MLIGAHVSVAGGVDRAVSRQVDVGGNCGQLFTASPQVWRGPDIDDAEAARFREETAARLLGPWVIHASYLVNLATPDADLRERSIASLQAEVDAAVRLDVPFVNVHLGAHTGAGEERGLDNAVSALRELSVPSDVTVLAESDAGAGTKLGGRFEHLARAVEGAATGVCLDTAHAFAAGYDLGSAEGVEAVVDEFDAVVGLEHLRCVHLNDSKHPRGSARDEHAHLGEGSIGEAGIAAVLNHPALRDRPFVLETPTEDGRSFAWNVARARELRE